MPFFIRFCITYSVGTASVYRSVYIYMLIYTWRFIQLFLYTSTVKCFEWVTAIGLYLEPLGANPLSIFLTYGLMLPKAKMETQHVMLFSLSEFYQVTKDRKN